jgi:hypothetical protein
MANPATIKTAPNVLQVSFNGTWGQANKVSNVWHWQFSSSVDEDTCRLAAQYVIGNWQEYILDILVNYYVLDTATWILLSTADSPTGVVQPDQTKPLTGALTGATTPPAVAALVHKELATSSRSGRNGRCYLQGILEANVDHYGIITPATVTSGQAAVTLFYTNTAAVSVSGGTATMCLPHWTADNKPTPEQGGLWPAQSVGPISSLRFDNKVATQRRRMR